MALFPSRSPLWNLGACVFASAVALAWVHPLRADDSSKPEAPTLSDKTSEAVGKIPALWEAKDWDGALGVIEGLIPTTDPDSYDMAFIQFYRAKMLLEKEKNQEAVQPLETTLAIVDRHPNYIGSGPPLGPDEVNQVVYFLANLYGQQASETKSKEVQREDFDKAIAYFKRYLQSSAKPNVDVQYSYTTMLVSEATVNPKRINKDELHLAEQEALKGLRMSLHPKEEFYILYVYALQQDEKLEEAAKYSELLVQIDPKKKEYWQQLWAFYTNMGGQEKDPEQARIWFARAINTYYRAQSYGFLKDKRDKLTLITLYFTANQFRRATELLATGLENGSVDSDNLQNWQLLAYSYQQIGDYSRAIQTYKSAEEHFPDDGDLDFEVGLFHRQMEDNQAAYEDFAAAVGKSHLSRGFDAYQQLAYQAYQLGEDKNSVAMYEVALKAWKDGTKKYPRQAAKDSTWKSLHQTIEETINHYNAVKNAIDAAVQSHQ